MNVRIIDAVYRAVWGIPMLVLILSVGILLTVKTRFVQLRLLPKGLRDLMGSLFASKGEGKSSFQALCTALAATVGTGNLAGVAGAIALGGPGAIFWMWICGLLGMAIKFAEATLAVSLRSKNIAGEWVGGPMYMIRNGLPSVFSPMAGVYALLGVVAAFGVGNATQINTVLCSFQDVLCYFNYPCPQWLLLLLAFFLAVLLGSMLLGGAKRIGGVTQRLVPFAAALYLCLCTVVLIARVQVVPQAFAAIVGGAFSPAAVTGGVLGSAAVALRTGLSRGLFTNEAGMGTASIAHAGAQVSHPVEQGTMGIVEVFLDTIVICTMTALVILVSGVPVFYGVDAGICLTTEAFVSIFGDWVSVVICISLILFALATALGWGLYGIRCAQYLFGASAWRVFVYLQMAVVVLGAWIPSGAVWRIAEIVNGLMAIPNLIALIFLRPKLQDLLKDYQQKKGSCHYENLRQR